MFWNKPKAFPWKEEWQALAIYNAEVSRGIVHTDAWRAKMAALQAEFNSEQIEWAKNNGHQVIGG